MRSSHPVTHSGKQYESNREHSSEGTFALLYLLAFPLLIVSFITLLVFDEFTFRAQQIKALVF